MGALVTGFINFLKLQAVNKIRQGAADDRLGNRENRKRLAARAFLEGYEPDPRLFAKGPDDAPDVVVPDPLVEQTETALPPQAPVAPELVPAGPGPSVVGESEYVVREIERINQNVAAIALAMEQNVRSDAEYRQSVIDSQRESLARRGAARSQRRSERRRGFLSRLVGTAGAPVQKAGGRLRRAGKELGKGLLGFAALQTIDQLKKKYDEMESQITEFLRNIPGIGSFFGESEKPGPQTYQPSSGIPQKVADDKDFTSGVSKLAKKYNIPEDYLYAVMSFETGGTFDPAIENPDSGATGLIQFMPSTAKGLGTTVEALRRMNRAQQLEFVDKYFSNKGIEGGNLDDVYMAVLFPAAVGKEDDFVLFGKGATIPGYGEGSAAYRQNKGLDINKDGSITKAEASSKVRAKLPKDVSPYQKVNFVMPDASREGAPAGGGYKIGDVISYVPPIYIDQTTKKANKELGAGMSPGFDVASAVMDPSLGRSVYEPLLGIGVG